MSVRVYLKCVCVLCVIVCVMLCALCLSFSLCGFVGVAAKVAVCLFVVYCVMLHELFVCVVFVFVCLCVLCLMCLCFLCVCIYGVCDLNCVFL